MGAEVKAEGAAETEDEVKVVGDLWVCGGELKYQYRDCCIPGRIHFTIIKCFKVLHKMSAILGFTLHFLIFKQYLPAT